MMSEGKSETVAKALLKSLCCGNGWSYAVFWGFNQQNSLFLTLKDAYYEEDMGGLIDDMLLQVNILGSGVVGQVAFTKNHKWMLSDTNSVWQSHHGLADNCHELLQDDDSEFYGQFSCGIKTIAVISVEPLGVVQFGSNQKLPERMEFVDETKKLFQGTDIETIFAQSSSSSANGDVFGFMSPEPLPSPDFVDPIMNMVQSFPVEAFSLFDDQFQNGGVETQTNFSSYGFHSANYFNIAQPSCSSVWGLEGSSLTSLQENISPGAISQDCDNAFCVLPDQLERPVMTSTNELGQSAFDEVLDGFGCKMPENSDNIRKQWDFGTSISGCTSEHSIGSKDWPSNRLFSKLGLDHLLNDNPSSSCSFVGSSCNDQLSSTKKRRIEHPLASQREVTVSLIGENCSTNVMNTKDHEKPSKTVKKKAKPGTRPIPKDRVRTYERLAELRELIPNGGKMSIDRLLHQTIKQLLFFQSVTRLAEGLKKTEELKDKKGRKDTNSNSNTSGVTWACEIENQTMVCPLVVEDLCTPGQMLIEILCQEQGFFLEIVDIIRGFGLNILKGTMELRETKIWAHFIVEPEENAFVSRHELFSSLLQLLQLSGPSTSSNCSESAVPFPVSLPEGLY